MPAVFAILHLTVNVLIRQLVAPSSSGLGSLHARPRRSSTPFQRSRIGRVRRSTASGGHPGSSTARSAGTSTSWIVILPKRRRAIRPTILVPYWPPRRCGARPERIPGRAGRELQTRLSDVAPVRDEGFDHTTQGAYAAAAGVAKALGLSQEQTANAIAISGTVSATTIEASILTRSTGPQRGRSSIA